MPESQKFDEEQTAYVGGFWFVMKWVLLFLVSWMMMTQLAILIKFRSDELWQFKGLLFMIVSSFLSCIFLNVVIELALRSMRDNQVPRVSNEDESNDETQ